MGNKSFKIHTKNASSTHNFLPLFVFIKVISCSGSGEIFYTDIEREDTYGTHRFDCHFGSTYKVIFFIFFIISKQIFMFILRLILF